MSNISRAQGFAVTLRCPLDVCVVLVEYPDMSDASPIVEAIQAVETQVRAKYFFASRAACYTRVRLQLVLSLCTVEWPQHLGTLAGCSRHGVMMGSPLRCGCRVDRCARVRSLDHLQMACAVPASPRMSRPPALPFTSLDMFRKCCVANQVHSLFTVEPTTPLRTPGFTPPCDFRCT